MEKSEKERVVVSGLDIPFRDLVWFMVKLAPASIPAMLILYIFIMLFCLLFGGIANLTAPLPGI